MDFFLVTCKFVVSEELSSKELLDLSSKEDSDKLSDLLDITLLGDILWPFDFFLVWEIFFSSFSPESIDVLIWLSDLDFLDLTLISDNDNENLTSFDGKWHFNKPFFFVNILLRINQLNCTYNIDYQDLLQN